MCHFPFKALNQTNSTCQKQLHAPHLIRIIILIISIEILMINPLTTRLVMNIKLYHYLYHSYNCCFILLFPDVILNIFSVDWGIVWLFNVYHFLLILKDTSKGRSKDSQEVKAAKCPNYNNKSKLVIHSKRLHHRYFFYFHYNCCCCYCISCILFVYSM